MDHPLKTSSSLAKDLCEPPHGGSVCIHYTVISILPCGIGGHVISVSHNLTATGDHSKIASLITVNSCRLFSSVIVKRQYEMYGRLCEIGINAFVSIKLVTLNGDVLK